MVLHCPWGVIILDDPSSTSNWAYASLLAGGILIVVGGFVGAWMMGPFAGMMGYGMMGDHAPYMGWSWSAGAAWWMGVLGFVTGGIVLYAAYRLRHDASDRTTAGTLGIVGGALSLLAMGGWIVGAALAILGGALALGGPSTSERHPPTH